MFKKEILISNFIEKKKILSYLEFIHNRYNVEYKNLFVYSIEGNDDEYIVTFKRSINDKNIVNHINGSQILHFKSGCLFSINALNKLCNGKDEYIDWEKYRNKLVLLNKNELSIKTINKIEDKCIFFN